MRAPWTWPIEGGYLVGPKIRIKVGCVHSRGIRACTACYARLYLAIKSLAKRGNRTAKDTVKAMNTTRVDSVPVGRPR